MGNSLGKALKSFSERSPFCFRIFAFQFYIMPRILAIDFGEKRTGIAVTDELQIIASGLTTIPSETAIDFLRNYFANENVAKVLIGEPRQMNNEPSQSAPVIEAFVSKFTEAFPEMKIVRVDERFTSKLAFKAMLDSGLSKKQRQNKGLIDEISATIMLQDYLTRKMI
jgi:putative Holliday junction resolvase